jgi:hypothetical protein
MEWLSSPLKSGEPRECDGNLITDGLTDEVGEHAALSPSGQDDSESSLG